MMSLRILQKGKRRMQRYNKAMKHVDMTCVKSAQELKYFLIKGNTFCRVCIFYAFSIKRGTLRGGVYCNKTSNFIIKIYIANLVDWLYDINDDLLARMPLFDYRKKYMYTFCVYETKRLSPLNEELEVWYWCVNSILPKKLRNHSSQRSNYVLYSLSIPLCLVI